MMPPSPFVSQENHRLGSSEQILENRNVTGAISITWFVSNKRETWEEFFFLLHIACSDNTLKNLKLSFW